MTPNKKETYLTIALFAFMLAMPASSNAQKSKYIGWYQGNAVHGDTLSGYFFLSLDSFKIIYTIDVNDGKDMKTPLSVGAWSLIKKDDKDIGLFYFKDTTIEVQFSTFTMGGDGGLSGQKGVSLKFGKKFYSCFNPQPSKEL